MLKLNREKIYLWAFIKDMQIAETIDQAKSILSTFREKRLNIGLVPTMGALHKGHLSLIESARQENEVVVVSLFVNPTQFNDRKDFINYPRDTGRDMEMLSKENIHLLFMPSTHEMYPDKNVPAFDLNGLDEMMEGAFRPGHFQGVAQIVTRLFNAISPDRAYFGEKDYQQLAIIRHLTRSLKIPVEIVACPIIREANGLAFSTRNQLLSPEQKAEATIISDTLKEAVGMIPGGNFPHIKNYVTSTINSHPLAELEYFEIIDAGNLRSLDKWTGYNEALACIAVRFGPVRLIDNMKIS